MPQQQKADEGTGLNTDHPAAAADREERPDEPGQPMARSPQQLRADPEPTPVANEPLDTTGSDTTDAGTTESDTTESDTAERDAADSEAEPTTGDHDGAPRPDEGAEEPLELFRSEDVERFHAQWQEIQIRFVDDPRDAVQSADHLLTEVIKSLATAVNGHKTELEGRWGSGGQTEDLRLALRRYRTFLNQLLDL